ncbi:MAG: hypothetical protein WBB25_00305 [Sulfitobacter sp.]
MMIGNFFGRSSQDRNLIMVTGAPRSGTTVVGTQLGLAERCTALYEPMNGDSGDRSVSRYFERPGHGGFSEETFDDLVHRIANLDLRLRPGVFEHEHGWKKAAKLVIGGQSRRSLTRAKFTPGLQTIIWKDPLAALAARAAVERFDIPVVITYRPPEAVAASYKRLNWYFEVHDIADSLGIAHPDGGVLHARGSKDLIDGAASLWAMIYGDLLDLAQERPDKVHLVRMEDVITDPKSVYDELFARLGLSEGSAAAAGIAAAEAQRDATGLSDQPSGHPHSKNRNLRAANEYWRDLLTPEEIETIHARTDRIRTAFELLPAVN